MGLEKPYYSSITVIILVPLLVFIGAIVYQFAFGEEIYNVYMVDKLFHIIGGVSITISAAGIVWNVSRIRSVDIQDRLLFVILIFGLLCFVVISWEILEYIVLYPDKYMTYTDLIIDMICGLLGGVLALLFCLQNKPY